MFLNSNFKPKGDQAQAIDKLVEGLKKNYRYQTLKGVTGSGKTFTIANVIDKINKPTLIISHNKTLASQLYQEFKSFFPKDKVHFYISYYDYYQPEAYLKVTDTYIEKAVLINKYIEKQRISSVMSLLTSKNTVVIASVSCIYGASSKSNYEKASYNLNVSDSLDMMKFRNSLINMQYNKTENSILSSGEFKINGDIFEIYPNYENYYYRVLLDFDTIKKITKMQYDNLNFKEDLKELKIYPNALFISLQENINQACDMMLKEAQEQYNLFKEQGKDIEAERILKRINYDVEMLKETGYCNGVENYVRYLNNLGIQKEPDTLLDFFDDYLLVIDESHITLPQIRGMYEGDRARKLSLIDGGFRLKSALDNRPLKIDEFKNRVQNVILVSATPSKENLELSNQIVEQIIRPTGLLDPEIEIRNNMAIMEEIYEDILKNNKNKQRTLVLTLTKKMSEDLTTYLSNLNLNVKYIHSDLKNEKRVDIIMELRRGKIDIIIGINLLREGLDLPEVSLVIILDADKMGFLRSKDSLIQMIGRAARHKEGRAILYCNNITDAIKDALKETKDRRKIQIAYNKKYNIIPTSIKKDLKNIETAKDNSELENIINKYNLNNKIEYDKCIFALKQKMLNYAQKDDFDMAIIFRNKIEQLNENTR